MLVLALTLALPSAWPTPSYVDADVEPNNVCADATSWGSVTSGYDDQAGMFAPDIRDYSEAYLMRGEHLHVSVTPPAGGWFDLVVLRNCVSAASSPTWGVGVVQSVSGTASQTTHYQMLVAQNGAGGYGTYTITLDIHPNDGGTHGDAGETPSGALPLSTSTSGAIRNHANWDFDTWSATILPLTLATFTLTPDCPADLDLELLDRDGNLLGWSTSPVCSSQTVSCYAAAPSTAFPRVFETNGDEGSYDLAVTRTTTPVPPSGVPLCPP